MRLITPLFSSFLLVAVFLSPAHAQIWHALPSISQTAGASEAQFSNDGKKVFFLAGSDSVKNIWSAIITDKWGGIIAGPKNPPVAITKFTDHGVVRFFHLLGSPDVLYMRATDDGKDYHIYRIPDDGSVAPQDVTPTPEGVTNILIGASYNGRYVYYTSNLVNRDKTDVYRYDTQQYTSENVFPNDKDYVALAWTRDQTALLMERPSTGQLSIYDMETTERKPITLPNTDSLIEATFDPGSQDIIVLQKGTSQVTRYTRPLASTSWKSVPNNNADCLNFSYNGNYQILRQGTTWQVRQITSDTLLPLPANARPLAISSKGTMLLYTILGKLYLYDIAKKTSLELPSTH